MAEDAKKPWESKTVWGATLSLLFSLIALLKVLGVDVPTPSEEDINFLSDKITLIAASIGAIVSSVLAIYGRFKAKKPVKL